MHLLGRDLERAYVRETVEWINADAEVLGADKIEGHSEEWLAASNKTLEMIVAKYGIDPRKLVEEEQPAIPAVGTAKQERAPVAVAAA